MSSTQIMTTDLKGKKLHPNPSSVGKEIEESCLKMLGNIQDALALSRKLEKVLQSVHQKMLERNIAEIELVLEKKVKLLNMLQMNGALREHYLQSFGFSPNQQGISDFFNLITSQFPNSPIVNVQQLGKYWVQLEASANRCQQINSANGRLLARLSASTKKIIELAFSEQQSEMYDQNGHSVKSMAE